MATATDGLIGVATAPSGRQREGSTTAHEAVAARRTAPDWRTLRLLGWGRASDVFAAEIEPESTP